MDPKINLLVKKGSKTTNQVMIYQIRGHENGHQKVWMCGKKRRKTYCSSRHPR